MVASFRAGKFIIQHDRKSYEYKSFRPGPVNRAFGLDADINITLAEATHLLGELNAYSQLIPDVDFFIHMHVFKEATESSRIEGTQTEFDEIFLKEVDVKPEKRDDWEEVQNYTKAMNYAIKKLDTLPLSMRLLKETHKTLLSGVRGKDKRPGEVRTSQNWIGTSLKDALFIPPHQDELPDLLSDLEKFWHNSEIKVPDLVKAAISHYQFETIHPFLDGNGRIGRLLITLHLIDRKILSKPVLYLSDFFAKNKGQYFDALTLARQSNNLKHWLLFFMNGVIESAKVSKKTFEQIISLRSVCEEKILGMGQRAENGKILLEYLYSYPLVDVKQVSNLLNLTPQSSNTLVGQFTELGILKELTGFKRNRLFSFVPYLKIFK